MQKSIIKDSGGSINLFMALFAFIFFYIIAATTYSFADDVWKEVKDLSFKADIAFSKPLTGVYNNGNIDYDEGQKDVKISATGNLSDSNGTIIKSFTNLKGILVQGKDYDYFRFDIDQFRLQIWENNSKTFKKVLIRSIESKR